jgi:hypothetical protein
MPEIRATRSLGYKPRLVIQWEVDKVLCNLQKSVNASEKKGKKEHGVQLSRDVVSCS